jgi:PHD/YefM family antitoxin component YafN of YafNO toxin-antitoxin module
MALPNIFEPSVTATTLERLKNLSPESKPVWGTMNSAQMLAHLNVAYDVTYGKMTPKVGGFMKLMMKLFVKKMVVSEKPYKKNSRTAPYFVIADAREFDAEKTKLADYIKTTEAKGAAFFEGKESISFGKMSSQEWNNQFYKHMNHHFQQFGV